MEKLLAWDPFTYIFCMSCLGRKLFPMLVKSPEFLCLPSSLGGFADVMASLPLLLERHLRKQVAFHRITVPPGDLPVPSCCQGSVPLAALLQCPLGLPDCRQLHWLTSKALLEEVEVLLGKSSVSIGRMGLETGRGILACSCGGRELPHQRGST